MAYNRSAAAAASIETSTKSAIGNNEGSSFGPSILSFPAGVKPFKLDPNKANVEQYVNIIPWAIETDKHPRVAKGEAKIGDNDFMLDVWVHNIDGVLKGTSLCMSHTYGRACPFEQETEGQNMPAAKRRTIFWVQECDRNGNPIGDGQPKIFNTSHFTFTKVLLEEADIQGKSFGLQGSVPFANPDKGYVVGFRYRMENSGGGIKYASVSRVDFYERRQPLPDKLLDSVPALDSLLVMSTHESVRDALYGKGASAAAEEASSAPADTTAPAASVAAEESF